MILIISLLVALPCLQPSTTQEVLTLKPETLSYVSVDKPKDDAPYRASDETHKNSPLAEKYAPISEYERDISVSGIRASSQRLVDALKASPTFDPANDGANGQRLRSSLLQEIANWGSDLASIPAPTESVANPFEAITRMTTNPAAIDESMIISEMVYFEGRPSQVIFRRWTTGIAGDGTTTRGVIYYATSGQAIEFRAVIDRLNAIVACVRKTELHGHVGTLSSINQGWSNYLQNGFSQFPWEAYINGYVTPMVFHESSWYDPPRDQLVFFHPELGVLADLRDRESASAQGALFLHTLGYIRYFGDTRDWYLGASATISLSDSDFGLGVGPTIHFGDTGRGMSIPQFSVGLLWHDFDGGGSNPVVGISIDLARLLDKAGPEALFRNALAANRN